MTKKQLLALLAPLGAGGYAYSLTPQMGKVVEALVNVGSQKLPGLAIIPAPKPADLEADRSTLAELLRNLGTPEGSASYGLFLAPAQGEAAAQLSERYAATD